MAKVANLVEDQNNINTLREIKEKYKDLFTDEQSKLFDRFITEIQKYADKSRAYFAEQNLETPEPLNKPDWADSAFDAASDNDQSMYFSRAYDALEANPELKAMYDKDPQMRLGEELWDIDNKNPNPRYTTLKDFINKHKFNVPVGRYSGKPESEYYKNVLALIGDSDDHFGEEQAEGLSNLLEGLRDGPKDERW